MRFRMVAVTVACAALVGFGGVAPAAAATVSISTPAALIAAMSSAAAGDVLRLDSNITVVPSDGRLAVPAAGNLVLNLNGHELEVTAGTGFAGIEVGQGSALVIRDSLGGGALTVTGGGNGAGIGGSDNQTSGMITIESGTVEANGGDAAAGIGGGHWGAGGTTLINGGTVIAAGGADGAGIGAGVNKEAGTVTITAGVVTASSGAGDYPGDSDGAGIGGAGNGGSGIITISGGTVTATAHGGSAGIGGGGLNGGENGGVITISGGIVDATGGEFGGAGIGAASGRSAGPVIIEGGTVTARGGANDYAAGSGIGQGATGNMTVAISGGSVTAIGGSHVDIGGAAGIGGGSFSSGVATSITGGTVVARGMGGGAGIGGGISSTQYPVGSGAAVSVGAGADVTVSAQAGASAVGQGNLGAQFGSLGNAGQLTIEAGSTLRVPPGVTIANSGTLAVSGAVVNEGAIQNTGTVTNPGNVSVHNYLLQFAPNGGSAAPGELRVFAATLAAAGLGTPPAPTRSNFAFQGWFSEVAPGSNAQQTLGVDTMLGNGADGPLTQTWYARWIVSSLEGSTTRPAEKLPATGVSQEVGFGLPVGGAILLMAVGALVLAHKRKGAAGT